MVKRASLLFNSFCSKVARVCCLFYRSFKFPNDRARKIMDKSLGTLLRFWGVFQFTQVQPLPSPHKQCWTRASRIFFRVSTLYRVGGGRTARKFRKECTVLTGNREMTENMNITVLSQGLLSRIVAQGH